MLQHVAIEHNKQVPTFSQTRLSTNSEAMPVEILRSRLFQLKSHSSSGSNDAVIGTNNNSPTISTSRQHTVDSDVLMRPTELPPPLLITPNHGLQQYTLSQPLLQYHPVVYSPPALYYSPYPQYFSSAKPHHSDNYEVASVLSSMRYYSC